MTYKAPALDIQNEAPFANDALDREDAVQSVANFLEAVDGPFVLALDSPWGTGKTTFVKMLRAVLEGRDLSCLYFDAWRNDFTSDPLVAFVGELESAFDDKSAKRSKARKKFELVRKAATSLAKRAVPIAGKLALAGLVDPQAIYKDALEDLAEEALSDAIDAYASEKNLMGKFRESLQDSISELLKSTGQDKIVILVDELDRCRPTYAVDLLERIKHFFDVENVVFVLSLDKTQLSVSLGAVYGEKIDSREYLRRFIDLEFTLPKPDPEAFTRHLYQTFDLATIFAERTAREFENDDVFLLEIFVKVSELLRLNLRAREQTFTMIRIALSLTESNFYIYPHLLTTLALLKIGAPDVYRAYAFTESGALDVVDYIRGLDGGSQFIDDHLGAVLQAYLMAAKQSRLRELTDDVTQIRAAAEDMNLPESVRSRASKILRIYDEISMRDKQPPLGYVISKLELASTFK